MGRGVNIWICYFFRTDKYSNSILVLNGLMKLEYVSLYMKIYLFMSQVLRVSIETLKICIFVVFQWFQIFKDPQIPHPLPSLYKLPSSALVSLPSPPRNS